MHTYSGATATRTALLLAGFAVGFGDVLPGDGKRPWQRLAVEDLAAPLDRRWLDRVSRSSAPFASDAPGGRPRAHRAVTPVYSLKSQGTTDTVALRQRSPPKAFPRRTPWQRCLFRIFVAVVPAMAIALSLASGCKNSSPPSGDGGTSSAWVAAVGAQGAFVQTFDDASWTARSIEAQDLFAVTCFGNLDGWAAGAGGLLAHTMDGGQTWTRQDAHTNAPLRAVRFASATIGVVAGDAGTLAVTT